MTSPLLTNAQDELLLDTLFRRYMERIIGLLRGCGPLELAADDLCIRVVRRDADDFRRDRRSDIGRYADDVLVDSIRYRDDTSFELDCSATNYNIDDATAYDDTEIVRLPGQKRSYVVRSGRYTSAPFLPIRDLYLLGRLVERTLRIRTGTARPDNPHADHSATEMILRHGKTVQSLFRQWKNGTKMIHTTNFIATFGVKTKWKHLMAEQKVYIPTVGEEIGNAVSHGVMLCLTLAALPFAAVRAYIHDGTLAAVAASVFVISLLLMFLGSTLYHSMLPASRHKEVFHILDHIFIYVAIAGTYTPIALSVIGGWQGTFITILQWAMVLFGIVYKSLARRSIPAISLTIYLVMGWTIVFFMPLFVRHASVPLLALIAAGGLLYTAGAWVYARKGFRYHHMVWHLLINLAAICHFTAIVFYLY